MCTVSELTTQQSGAFVLIRTEAPRPVSVHCFQSLTAFINLLLVDCSLLCTFVCLPVLSFALLLFCFSRALVRVTNVQTVIL